MPRNVLGGYVSREIGRRVEGSAIFSPDGRYRYLLARWWGPGRRVLFLGLNPSDAGAEADDPTARKCAGFAWRLGFEGFEICNLFALVSTDPRAMLARAADGADVVGPHNDPHTLAAMRACDAVVCAWGMDRPRVAEQARHVAALAGEAGRPLYCLATTKYGAPRHPLMLSYKFNRLQRYEVK